MMPDLTLAIKARQNSSFIKKEAARKIFLQPLSDLRFRTLPYLLCTILKRAIIASAKSSLW
jgi:hypothetical protein